MPKTFEAFKKWIDTDISEEYGYIEAFRKWYDSIDWKSLTRFNQGDAFFVGNENASTEVGKQEDDTILMKGLKNLK